MKKDTSINTPSPMSVTGVEESISVFNGVLMGPSDWKGDNNGI